MTGKVRIISGRWRGRKLAVPDLPGLRPSGDRAREVLFNWLQPRLHGSRCLDLFAGTGTLGLEAASRGAASVTLVERDRQLVEALRTVANQWPGGDTLRIVLADALGWLEQAGGPFDLVFVDPPFGAGLYTATLERLAGPGLLADDALVYVESAAQSPAPWAEPVKPIESASSPCMLQDFESTPSQNWRCEREKRVGEVRLQLLSRA
ncbi:MAG: 16S rRNA (guanine(966)-N(2))-methyltransferase RsmD [Wenzhouxiangellaceae bacterium]|nr:16S rRNA (guanine(966)-N(2))-methyltransferase RsmD [Wenzhouxiangellaceae bacterium]